MKKLCKLSVLLILNALIITPVWAKDKENDCSRLSIQISNTTHSPCRLVYKEVKHGNLVTSPPAVLPAGFFDRFDMKQTVYGPDITLEYECGGQNIRFSSQQNYCYLKAGQITGKVLGASSNRINAEHYKENGSYYYGRPGFSTWVISSS